jgi:hypothetical protein
VDAELKFDSLKPPPDKIEDGDEGQLPIHSPPSGKSNSKPEIS